MSRGDSLLLQARRLAPPTPFDTVIEWLLGGLLVFAPLALGAVEAWSEGVVVALAAGMVALLAARRFVYPDERLVWSAAFVPMALFAGLLAIQLIPLPAAWVGAISPRTLALKAELLADLPDATARLATTTLSFYPHATARDLRLVLVACAVFVVVVNVYRRPEQVKRLLLIVAGVGGAVAVLAILQNLTGATQIYWSVYTGGRRATSGPFVNYNNFSQFMNLSIGAGLALLLIQQREIERDGGRDRSGETWGDADRRKRWLWWLGAMVAAGMVSVFLSMSRMGVLSTLAAGVAAGVLISLRLRGGQGAGKGWVLAPIALVVFVGLLWAGFDKVYDRLATLRAMHQTDNGSRWQTLQNLPNLYKQFPAVGIGSGAHETFYPMFDRQTDGYRTAHVENEYAQVLEETGAAGAALVACFLIVILWHFASALRASSLWTRVGAIGLAFGLVAVLIHSASDFGQRLPAVAALSAVTCGLLVTLGKSARAGRAAASKPVSLEPAPGRGWLAWPATAVAVLALGWALWGATRTASAEKAWREAQASEAWLARTGWDGDDADYRRLLESSARAVALDPKNVLYRNAAAVADWRNLTRPGAVVDANTEPALRRVVRDLHDARFLCPTYGPNLSMAGQVETFALRDPAGPAHVRAGYRLSPADPATCFAAGLLDAAEGKWDDSLEKFRRVADRMFDDVADTYVHQFDRPDLALAAAGDEPARLFKLAETLQATKQDDLRETAKRAKAQAVERLKAKAAEPGAPAGVLAWAGAIAAREADHRGAIDYYNRALALDYGQVGWRMSLSRSLAASGDVKKALDEARVCLRLRPEDKGVRKWIQDLSVMPGGAVAERGAKQ